MKEKVKLSKNIKLFLTINLIASFAMGIFNMFVGIYLKEIGYQEQFVGSVLSINTFAIAIASVLSAYLIEKIGRKKSFSIGFICIAIGSSFIVLVNNQALIILMAIINGFGMSMKMTAEGMYIVENTSEKERVSVFSTLAERLGADTLVEGVETQEQVDWLMASGVKHVQGFYFAKPMSVIEATQILRKSQNSYVGTYKEQVLELINF